MAKSTQTNMMLAFTSYGLRIGIELFNPDIRKRVEACLPPGWTEITPKDLHRRYRLVDKGPDENFRYGFFVDQSNIFAEELRILDDFLDVLEGDIQIYVAEFATPHIFVHAGVVEWQGRAIVLPGSSFAGKSTLVTSLVQAGATYYSDEYAVLDKDGRVLPYLRRISLREGPHGPAGRLDLSASAPQNTADLEALPVGLVALLRYNANIGWCIKPLSSAAAILAMCEHSVPIQRRPADTLSILGKVVHSAQVIQGARGHVDDAVQQLLSLTVNSVWGT